MATITEIQTAIAQNATDAASEKLEVNAKLTAVASTLSTLEATVASLQAQIAAGTGVTAAQLDGILAGVQSTGADIRGIFTPDATAAPAPAPALVVVPVAPI